MIRILKSAFTIWLCIILTKGRRTGWGWKKFSCEPSLELASWVPPVSSVELSLFVWPPVTAVSFQQPDNSLLWFATNYGQQNYKLLMVNRCGYRHSQYLNLSHLITIHHNLAISHPLSTSKLSSAPENPLSLSLFLSYVHSLLALLLGLLLCCALWRDWSINK